MWFSAERPRIDKSGAAPLGGEILWIAPSAAYVAHQKRQARIAAFLLPLGPVLVIVAGAVSLKAAHPEITYEIVMKVVTEKADALESLVTLGLIIVTSILAVPAMLKRAGEGYRLGASRDGFHYEITRAQFFGRVPKGSIPWQKILYDGRMLVAGGKQFLLHMPRSVAVFDPDELRRVILANIPSDNLLTPSQLQMRQPVMWILAVTSIVLVVWFIGASFFQ